MENLDFLNLNSLRTFPLKEGVSKTSTDTRFVIPDDFMVDLILSAPVAIDSVIYISEIVNFPDQITIKLAEENAGVIGTFTITTATHTTYKTYFLTATSNYTGAVGKLIIANIESIALLPTGSFLFNTSATTVEMRTVIPTAGGVRSITFINSNGEEIVLTGDVTFQARQNMRFSSNASYVYFDAANGLGLNATCSASSTLPIKTINHIKPDNDGNFTISFLDCSSLSPTTNGLILTDVCNKPCMGCNDISELSTRLNQLEEDLLKLRRYFDDINATAIQLSNAINYSCELP